MPSQDKSPNRRAVLAGTAGVGIGAATAWGATQLNATEKGTSTDNTDSTPLAKAKVSFYGQRQAGVDTPAPAFGHFIAVDLNNALDKDAVKRLLMILTQDAAKLCAGSAPITDQEPELAAISANLTITFGFGPRIFDIVAPAKKPSWLKPLPAFPTIDKLEDQWNDGDLLIQLCADDQLTIAHAQRVLLKDVRSFGRIKWVQNGFKESAGSMHKGQTMRNLFGQVDGTVNPTTENSSMNDYVWGAAEGLEPWAPGGTSIVIRRIYMNLDTWDQADTPAREDAIGRKLSNGAPLTGQQESDTPDLNATNELGFTVIAPYAHIRRAHAQGPVEYILRRGYNYSLPVQDATGQAEHGQTSGGISNAGLIFAAYQADPVKQFVPIQKRLAELDMLNTWTAPIGSAVFAIPPGCQEGGFVGETLFS